MKSRIPVASKPRARLRRLRTVAGIAFTVTGLALLAGTGPGAGAYSTQADGNYDGKTELEPNASGTCGTEGRWVKFTLGGTVGNDKTASAVASEPYDMQYDELEAPDKSAHLINIDSVTSTADPTGPRAIAWVFTHAGGDSRDYWTWEFSTPVLSTPTPLDPGGHSNTNQLIMCVVMPPVTTTTTSTTTTTVPEETTTTSTTTTTLPEEPTTTTTPTTLPTPTTQPTPTTVPVTTTTEPPTIPPPVIIVTIPPPVIPVPEPTVPPTVPPTTALAVVAPPVETTTTTIAAVTASPAAEVLAATEELPFTGSETSTLTLVALALIAGGLVLTLVPTRRVRTS